MGCAWGNVAPAAVLRWVTLITPLFMVNFALGFNLKPKTWRGKFSSGTQSSQRASKWLNTSWQPAPTPRGQPIFPSEEEPDPTGDHPLHYWGAVLELTCWHPPKPGVSALFGATASGRVMLIIFTPLKPQAAGKRIFPRPIPFRATSRAEGQRDRERCPAGSQPPGTAAVPLVPGSIVLAPGDKQEKSHRCWPWVGDAGRS